MARTFSRPQQSYPAGTYGPFSVDSFTNANTDRLVLDLTVVGWPNATPLMQIEILWDTGGGARFDVSGPQVLPSVSFGVSVPKDGGQKRNVSGGTVTIRTFATITTAINLGAV